MPRAASPTPRRVRPAAPRPAPQAASQTASQAASQAAPQPRYAWLRQCLLDDIRAGRYPVGSLLPPEHALARTYGVSRHTVREATRQLAETGLIARRPGVGTRVCAIREPAPYVAALGSIEALFEYTNATRLELLGSETIRVDDALARALGCPPGSEWLALRTRRLVDGQVDPISFTTVYLQPAFAAIRDRLRGRHISIYAMLERHHGVQVHTVRQEIEAALMPAEAARLLGVRPRSAALLMRRAYLDRAGSVLAVSSNLYAAGRFRLVTSWSGASPARQSPARAMPARRASASPARGASPRATSEG